MSRTTNIVMHTLRKLLVSRHTISCASDVVSEIIRCHGYVKNCNENPFH